MTRYFRAVELETDGSTVEPVSYFGIHPACWGDDEPTLAFVETDVVDDLLAACEDARSHLRLLVAEGILEYVNTEVLDAALAKAKGERQCLTSPEWTPTTPTPAPCT